MIEHGHTFGIMHENYIDYTDECETMSNIASSLSDADMIDNIIYTDVSWDLIEFFNVSACLIPAQLVSTNQTVPTCALRTGSLWTKYSNACMKANRMKRLKLSRDYISIFIKYLNLGIVPSNYDFDSYDLDSINQISIIEKVKPKILTKLKTSLKHSLIK